jgi:hypothetical protein
MADLPQDATVPQRVTEQVGDWLVMLTISRVTEKMPTLFDVPVRPPAAAEPPLTECGRAILRLFREMPGPFTGAKVHALLDSRGEPFGRSTVDRTLAVLCRENLLRRVGSRGGYSLR